MCYKLTEKIVSLVTSRHTLGCEGGQSALSQLWPNRHTLDPGHPLSLTEKGSCSQWEHRGTETNNRHRQTAKAVLQYRWRIVNVWVNRALLLSSLGSNSLCQQNLKTIRSFSLFFHAGCFIFPIKRPLCLRVSSKHNQTVRCIDATQTDYLVWMAFPEQQRGQHNNR